MSKNPGFLEHKEERKNESFFKILQSADISSENMRAFPYHFVKNFSDEELSHAMKIKTQWGRSWEIQIFKNPRFYYMERAGWDKFLRENGLGGNEFLTFTHRGKLRFSVNIFTEDGKEVLQPLQSTAFLLSSSRIKTERRQGTDQVNVKEEEVVLSSDLSYLGSRTPEATGAGQRKRKLSSSGKEKGESSRNPESCKKKKPVCVSAGAPESSKKKSGCVSAGAPESSKKKSGCVSAGAPEKKPVCVSAGALESSKKKLASVSAGDPESSKKKPVCVSAGASSFSLGQFTTTINKSYHNALHIPRGFVKKHMPKERCKFVIHHSHKEQSWEVTYVSVYGAFSTGWKDLVREFPLATGDVCTFKLIKPGEIVLQVSKL